MTVEHSYFMVRKGGATGRVIDALNATDTPGAAADGLIAALGAGYSRVTSTSTQIGLLYSSDADMKAAIQGPGFRCSDAGVLSVYTPTAAETQAAREGELRDLVRQSLAPFSTLWHLHDQANAVNSRLWYVKIRAAASVAANLTDGAKFDILKTAAQVPADKFHFDRTPAWDTGPFDSDHADYNAFQGYGSQGQPVAQPTITLPTQWDKQDVDEWIYQEL